MIAKILRAGPLATVQDSGRFAYRAIGVGSGGALDPFAARIANLLVGNAEEAALIEISLGNFRVRFADERVIAWCGGTFRTQAGEEIVPAGHAFLTRAGDELTAAAPQLGCRMWLAISGGIEVPSILGSKSTDLRAGFGGLDGRALRDGDELPLAGMSVTNRARAGVLSGRRLSTWRALRAWSSPAGSDPILRIVRGADWNRFDASAHRELLSARFAVTPEADRMGVRLEGPELQRKESGDLLSEAVAPGTLQVPPNGRPILLLGDCQTIGGYPKIAHVITVDLPIAAQLRAGDKVRFREISVAEAQTLLLQRQKDLERFRLGLDLKMS